MTELVNTLVEIPCQLMVVNNPCLMMLVLQLLVEILEVVHLEVDRSRHLMVVLVALCRRQR